MIANYNDRPEELNLFLNDSIRDFQDKAEALIVSAQESKVEIDNIAAELENTSPISPIHLEAFYTRMERDLNLVAPIADIHAKNTCWQVATATRLKSSGLEPISEHIRIKGVLLELAASITLYDLYFQLLATINEIDRLRIIGNRGDSGYGIDRNQLKIISARVAEPRNLATIRTLVLKFDNLKDQIGAHAIEDDMVAYLDILISSSMTYREIKNLSMDRLVSFKLTNRVDTVQDNFSEINELITGSISGSFGNLVGRVERRKGILFGNREIEHYLVTHLQAGDILLEKTPFRLTDKLIPGYWGHVAIWTGTDEELRVLGIWEHPSIKDYHEKLSAQRFVAEALRQGTVLSSLANFLNIDDLAVLRRKELSQAEKRAVLIRTFRQIGKPYDFNFNVESTDRIVCSQLIYIAYPDIVWPTEYIVGRYTVSPDNIASKSVETDLFEVVVLIKDGEFIEEKENVMATLIKHGNE